MARHPALGRAGSGARSGLVMVLVLGVLGLGALLPSGAVSAGPQATTIAAESPQAIMDWSVVAQNSIVVVARNSPARARC